MPTSPSVFPTRSAKCDGQAHQAGVLDLAEDGRRAYVAEQALLDQNPALKDYFGIERSNAYFPVLGRPAKPVLSFLILGLGSGLNANLHCEESPTGTWPCPTPSAGR